MGQPIWKPLVKNSKKPGKGKATIEINNNTNMLPSHLVMAVFDETTGKMMEMRDLVRHPGPIIRNRWVQAVSNEFGRLLKEI